MAQRCKKDWEDTLCEIVQQAKNQDQYKQKIYKSINCPTNIMAPPVTMEHTAEQLPFNTWLFAAFSIRPEKPGSRKFNKEGIQYMWDRLRGNMVE